MVKSAPAIIGVILLPLSAAAAATFPERHVFELEGYSIEFSAGDEELAQAVLAGLVAEPREKVDAPTASWKPLQIDEPSLTVEALQGEQDAWLAEVCRYLAIEEPPQVMRDIFQKSASAFATRPGALQDFATNTDGLLLDLRRFALWRREDLTARLDAGHAIPNFSRDGESYVWEINFNREDGPAAEELATGFGAGAVPILVDPEDGETGAVLVQKLVSGARAILPDLSGMVQQMAAVRGMLVHMGVHTAVHEAVEAGIVWGLPLDSKDRRWFCDGVANYVAYRMIEQRVGPEAAKHYYNLEEQLARYEDVKDQIDLASWPAAEDQPDDMSEDEERLNQAHYPFATQVIAEVCARHGDELLPKLFREIQRTPAKKRSIDTVYRAYRKLTGEDLRDYFPNQKR